MHIKNEWDRIHESGLAQIVERATLKGEGGDDGSSS